MLLTRAALLPILLPLVACAATDAPPAPAPGEGEGSSMPMPPAMPLHPFLERMVGEWEVTATVPDPGGGPPMTMTALESVTAVGPWLVSSMGAGGSDGAFHARLAVAARGEGEGFHGTWIDSTSDFLWRYTGTLDGAGTTLTLETEGPSYADPDELILYRDVHQLVDDDRKVLRSSMRMADGSWVEMSRAEGRRLR